MDADLTPFLAGFAYEPGRLNARLVHASDGRELLQVRVELGILQFETQGRPDGLPSVFEAWEGVRSTEWLAAARLELVQVQQRARAFLAVGDAARALRDCEAALSLSAEIALAASGAETEWIEGARFSVIVLRTRAAVALLVAAGRSREAAAVVEAGLGQLRGAAEAVGIEGSFEHLADVRALRAMRDALVPQLPPAQRSELEARLRAAVLAENFELAAILRDELRLL
ncbi:MAG: UvrB/UvrC motif-containing protein [Phycisphaerales bacterium]